MGFKSFKSVEEDRIVTLPTGMSAARAAGGVAVGSLLAARGIDPTLAFNVGVALGLTDMEGDVISLASRFPRLKKALRIIPTKLGSSADAVADKVFAIGFIAGAVIGGYVPHWQAGGILATESATAAVTIYKKYAGADPKASKIGKTGMVVRCGAVACDMGIPAYAGSSHLAHEVLANAANVSSVAAIALGAASCAILTRVQPEQTPELLPENP